jgi:peptide/nickel transport system ATP-binding protein/oligopeptide transport system ATP-binding protein
MKRGTESVADGTVVDPILEVEGLRKYFPIQGGILNRTVGNVKAVDGVSFEIGDGETLGLVGESGCGKSTLGRTVLRLHEPTGGWIRYRGTDITDASKAELKRYRREMQVIFQDPASSLNPRLSVGKIIREPMHSLTDWSREKRHARTVELVEEVGLGTEHLGRAPHELSGGQRQRVGIARALSINPRFVVADEPTSALSVDATDLVIETIERLRDSGHTILIVSHNIETVLKLADRIGVLHQGEIVGVYEPGETDLSGLTELMTTGRATAAAADDD